MSPNDLVIFKPDPLRYGGELRVLDVEIGDDKIDVLCEQVHHDPQHEDEVPPRVILDATNLELADWWAADTT